jgi:hypothetical protein
MQPSPWQQPPTLKHFFILAAPMEHPIGIASNPASIKESQDSSKQKWQCGGCTSQGSFRITNHGTRREAHYKGGKEYQHAAKVSDACQVISESYREGRTGSAYSLLEVDFVLLTR